MSSIFKIKEVALQYYNTFSEIFEFKNILTLVVKLLLLILALLAPVKQIILATLFLVFVDFVTGVLAARVKRHKITSARMSQTIGKILVYITTIIVVHIVNEYMLFGSDVLPLEGFVAGFIALTELKSILENLDTATKSKHSLLKALSDKLSNINHRNGIDK